MNGSETDIPKNSLKAFDPANLWEKHEYVDMQAGQIFMLMPVTVGRLRDVSREPRFFSNLMVLRRGAPQQISFEIEGAVTLEDALDKWLGCANVEAEKFHKAAEDSEIRSRLSVPASARFTKPN